MRSRVYRTTLLLGAAGVLAFAWPVPQAAAVRDVNCAIVQFSDDYADEVTQDADRLEAFVRTAASNGAELVVAPENCLYRYSPWDQNGVTELDLANSFSNLVARFSGVADELNICLVFGLREPSGDGDKPTYQSAVFLDHEGTLLKTYRKRIPSSAEYSYTLSGGNDYAGFQTPLGRVWMQICKDMDGDGYVSSMPTDIDLFIGINKDDTRGWVKVDAGCAHAGCYGIGVNYAGDAGAIGGNSGFCDTNGTMISEAGDGGYGTNQCILYEMLPLPATGPLPGQIMVDPNDARWLVYNRDNNGDGRRDPFFMCGPGDPEGFLYRGTRNADGTRTGDQSALIDKVEGTGANCIYLMAVRSHGGDGGSTENPFANSDPAQGLDPDILDQWETWFTAMDANGIVIYFFFYDDSARIWDTGDTVGAEEQAFLEGLVDRYEHHTNLIWCVAEEYQERYTPARVTNIAAVIRAADDYEHVIAVHKLSGVTFSEFADDPSIDQFAIQYNQGTASALHSGMLTAWSNAAGKYNLNMSESANHGTGTTARVKNWACAMGGAYVMVLGMDIANTAVSDLEDCGRLVSFFEATDVNRMAPHDELAHGGTEYVLALPGQSYIAYASVLSGDIGLKGMTASDYDLRWLDCVAGTTVYQTNVAVSAGDQTWTKPGGFGDEVAVYIRLAGTAPNVRPTANPQSVTAEPDTPKDITLTYSDPDGPGPYTFAIGSGPSHGTLSGTGATRTYTPTNGYTGADSFDFTVSDGLTSSAPATVSITVQTVTNAAPVAQDQSLSTTTGTPVYVSLAYTDSDGPGPYAVTIVTDPSHGTLSGTGNDRTYTPNPGFTGTDSYTWRVNDGLADSNVATVTITVSSGTPVRIEAEDMALATYGTEAGAGFASGDMFISLKGGAALETGTASTNFAAASGDYDVVVAYFDEDDGQAQLTLRIAGVLIESWTLDADPGGSGADANTLMRRTVAAGLAVSNGSSVQIEGTETASEHARVDYVEFIPAAVTYSNTLERRIETGPDDVEQRPDGSMYMDSSDLELTEDTSGAQVIGLRFDGVEVAQGLTIQSAYLQFQTDETNDAAAALTLYGEAADDAAAFEDAVSNVSDRARTVTSVDWDPVAWDTAGENGAAQRSPNIGPIIREITARPGWLSGNALALMITGTGRRTAEAYEGVPAAAPLLHVAFGGTAGDTDGDGLADLWEQAEFGGTNTPSTSAGGDFDLDGFANIAEFISGTDAKAGGNSVFSVDVRASNATAFVAFHTTQATGTVYAGYNRHYALEQTATPGSGWTAVAGLSNVTATGGTVVYTNALSGKLRHFRGKVWLEQSE